MPYNPTYDLRGRRIDNTYEQVVQYDSPSGFSYDGQGNQLTLSSSYANLANIATTATHVPIFLPVHSGQVSLLSHVGGDGTIYQTSGIAVDNNGNISASIFYGTASISISASYAPFVNNPNAVSASWASSSLSSSYGLSSSYSPVQLPDITDDTINNRIGINNTNPQYALDVDGNINLTGYIISNDFLINSSGGNSYLNAAGGKVGIGTNAPNNELDVVGNISCSVITCSLLNGTASWANNTLTASLANTASYAVQSGYLTQSFILSNTQSQYQILSFSTGSLTSAIYDYSVFSGSNIRAGHINSCFINNTASWNDVSTVPIGSTTDITMSVVLTGSNVCLYAAASSSLNWKITAHAYYI